MSILDTVTKPTDRPIAVTIIGDAGLGKTSLAATFPKPIFIRSEDGLQAVPVDVRPDAFPVLQKADDLWPQLIALVKEEHSYQTCVIDTVTTLDSLFTDWVLDTDPKGAKSLNQAHGGFGAGRDMVASQHRRVRKACGLMMERGMNIVFVAHAETVRIEPPDANPYTKYAMRMAEKSTQPYVDNVDAVGFLRLETFVTGDGDLKKAISDGTRQLIVHAMAANVSKNRFGISEPLEVKMGENPFGPYMMKPAKKDAGK
jgi:hypothetical protein